MSTVGRNCCARPGWPGCARRGMTMDERRSRSLTEGRRVVGALRELGAVDAPQTLLPAVLGEIGALDLAFPVESPIGTVYVAYNGRGVSMVGPADDAETFAVAFRRRFGRPVRATDRPEPDVARAVGRRLRGERAAVRFDLRGLSEFERATLLKAAEIPRGEVRPYAWVAREIGRPGAVRAVGSALAANPVPLLIPCHRVVRSDGHIGAYIFGSQNKRAVLQAEGAEPDLIEALSRAGVRYYAHKTSGTFCLLTCGGEHRVPDPNRG